MLLTSCFYVCLALLSLFVVNKFKLFSKNRKVYTRTQFLEKKETASVPEDWKMIPKVENTKSEETCVKAETLESFILKEIVNSVKELEQKRVPFNVIDNNVLINRFNPNVEEYLPKARLNPWAQDFCPY